MKFELQEFVDDEYEPTGEEMYQMGFQDGYTSATESVLKYYTRNLPEEIRELIISEYMDDNK